MKLYYFDITKMDSELYEKEYDKLSDYRKDKVDRLKREKDRKLALAAGMLIAKGLKEYGLSEKNIIYGTYGNGKPYFQDYPEIHFNISHSHDIAIVVFSDREIGCDIEKIRANDLKVANRFFTEYEQKYVFGREENEREKAFYEVWTCKESYIKLTSKGLSQDLVSFSVVDEDGKIAKCKAGDGCECAFTLSNEIEGYTVAWAMYT